MQQQLDLDKLTGMSPQASRTLPEEDGFSWRTGWMYPGCQCHYPYPVYMMLSAQWTDAPRQRAKSSATGCGEGGARGGGRKGRGEGVRGRLGRGRGYWSGMHRVRPWPAFS